ncbi:DNA uptake protein and related DNA-binding proteins [Candidatus Scalindua japonica]|uniref:DNA uptake protein and related DNA-binding proteins n=2 Tax=Candidatus Scalindua japonica TaxID=1284222 RepID=A0A286U487_9BACT|nr:DNA uptake protein and related DNA-binding proteins [Candidatus Scalindua japonica]
MDVIRKVSVVLIVVALVSFVGGFAYAEHKAKVNINTATVEELMSLKGIGERKAESIVEHREAVGSFTTIDGLKDVKGVGDGIYNKIKDMIAIE